MIVRYIAAPVIGAAIGYCTNFIAVKMLFHPKKEIKVFGHRLPFTPGAIPKGKSRLAGSVGNAVGNDLITQADIEDKLLSDDIAEKIADSILDRLSDPVGELVSGLTGVSDEDHSAGREAVSARIAKYIAEAVAQVELSAVIAEKAPGIIREKLNNPMLEMFLTNELLAAVLSPVGTEIQNYIAEHGAELITPYVSQKLSELEEKPVGDVLADLNIERETLRSAVASLYKKAVSGCAGQLMDWLDLSSIVEEKINAMSPDELEKLVLVVMKKELNTIVNLGAVIGFILGLLNIFF